MDELTVTGIECFGHHGVFEHERREGQPFVIDLTLGVDTRPAAASDDVADTVHYGELAERVVAVIEGDPVDLVETLAQRIADAALVHPLVAGARVTVHKPSAPITVPFADVTVSIERTRP